MRRVKRDAIFSGLKEYCTFAKEHDYMEVCDWSNGEGFDVDINGKNRFSMTNGEFRLLKKLVKKLDKYD